MTERYAYPDVLVDTEWVAAHLEDPNLRIVEVDEDWREYARGHIPGAIGWTWDRHLNDPTRRDILGRSAFEALLSHSGIANEHTIIVYGDNCNWFAAFAFWVLKIYGHADVRLMNGGRTKWISERRPLDQRQSSLAPTLYVAKPPDLSLRATRDFVWNNLDDPTVEIVDVRSPQEYRGEILAPPGLSETAQRGGHIPGAANVYWIRTVRPDCTFASYGELADLYESKGIAKDYTVITYCRIGERSSHTWFVLKYLLGYPSVMNYDGSWTEWGSMVDMPIARGQEPYDLGSRFYRREPDEEGAKPLSPGYSDPDEPRRMATARVLS